MSKLPKALLVLLAFYAVGFLFIGQAVLFSQPSPAQRKACAALCEGRGFPHTGKKWPLFWTTKGYCYCESRTDDVDLDKDGNASLRVK